MRSTSVAHTCRSRYAPSWITWSHSPKYRVPGTTPSLLESAVDLKCRRGLPTTGSTKNQVSYGETLRQSETDCSRQSAEIQLCKHMDELQELGFRLDEVARLYTRRFEQRAQTLSLHLAQCKALVLLAENEGVSQTRLSQISEIDPARLVGILDRLEAGGWAQRRPQPGDRRVRSLAITEHAKPVLELI